MWIALILGLLVGGCAPSPADDPALLTGAERLVQSDYRGLEGLSVGLIANHTTTVDGEHLADLLAASGKVDLAALFGPEHGLRGDADAGARIDDAVDDRTGVPIYSLYGERRSPPDDVLADLDVLLFDIQDVGARFYTYISTMGRAMQAAARAGTPFWVLDRPNPLGGERMDGFILEPEHTSFVGLYPIPIQHGLTVGELALMIQGEAWLPGLDSLELKVVEVEGWKRSALWSASGREWVPTSPNIPGFAHALIYPGTCLFEATNANEGRGTEDPFLTLGAPWLNAERAAEELDTAGLEGVRFEALRYTPISIPGKSTHPRFENEELAGIRVIVEDAALVRPLEVGLQLLRAFTDQAPDPEAFTNASWMQRLAGTERMRTLLLEGASPDEIMASWAEEIAAFADLRAAYLLYE